MPSAVCISGIVLRSMPIEIILSTTVGGPISFSPITIDGFNDRTPSTDRFLTYPIEGNFFASIGYREVLSTAEILL